MKRKNTQKIVSVCATALITFSQSVPAFAQAINKNPNPIADLVRSLLEEDEAQVGDKEDKEESQYQEEQKKPADQENAEEPLSLTEDSQENEQAEEQAEEQATSLDTTKETADVITGEWGTAPWRFDEETGVLTIEPGTLSRWETSPWNRVGANKISRELIKKIVFQGATILPQDSSYLFSGILGGLTNLVEIQGMEYLDSSQVTRMNNMFSGDANLVKLDFSSFNTSEVTTMSNMFRGCSSLVKLDLSSFDTDRVTTMFQMFRDCSFLVDLNISSFDTSQVTNMSNMFNGCSSIETLDFSKFNTSKVTTMADMFNGCSKLVRLDLSSFDTSQVLNMGHMFRECSSLVELDISAFNTSQVTTMLNMFNGCSSLVNLDVSSFNTSKVTNMGSMFRNCSSLVELTLSSFDTSQVTIMSEMFRGNESLLKLDLSSFDTSKATMMNRMFEGSQKLEELNLSSFDMTDVQATNMFKNTLLKRLIIGNDFKFASDEELGNPRPTDERPVTGNWIREDGQSKGYAPLEFMAKYGQGELIAGAYVAEVVPQSNLELCVDFNKESGKAIIGDEIMTTMTVKHSNGSQHGSVATKIKIELTNVYADKVVLIEKLDSDGLVLETSEQALVDSKIQLDKLYYGESYSLRFVGVAWNNAPQLEQYAYSAVLSYFDAYDLIYTKKSGNYEVKSGPFGFTKVPEALKFKETKLTSQLRNQVVEREETDWRVSLEDYRGTNSHTLPEEVPVVDRVDWEMTATAQGFKDSKGNFLPEGILGVVFLRNGVPNELSIEEQVIESHSVKNETPKEHNQLDLSWEELDGFKGVVHHRNGLKKDENYTAQVDFELRIAP